MIWIVRISYEETGQSKKLNLIILKLSNIFDIFRFFIVVEAVIWNILLQGCIQPILALFVAIVLCPMASFLLFAGSIFHY